jgi:hypothetical protein
MLIPEYLKVEGPERDELIEVAETFPLPPIESRDTSVELEPEATVELGAVAAPDAEDAGTP